MFITKYLNILKVWIFTTHCGLWFFITFTDFASTLWLAIMGFFFSIFDLGLLQVTVAVITKSTKLTFTLHQMKCCFLYTLKKNNNQNYTLQGFILYELILTALLSLYCILILVHNPRTYCHVLVHWETTALTVVTVDQSEPSLVDPLAGIGQQ